MAKSRYSNNAITKYRCIEKDSADRLAGTLKGLAHPLRLRIIAYLCAGEGTVSQMCEALESGQSAVSQHLAPLRMLGLVQVDRTGGRATYSLAQEGVRGLVDCLMGCDRGA